MQYAVFCIQYSEVRLFMAMFDTLSQLRRDYQKGTLDESSLSKNPYEQFKHWFDEAVNAEIPDANGMAVSTVSPEGKPSSRMVLLKKYDESGFVFFTNYDSQKGKDIENNPHVSLLFFWKELEKQIRIDGTAVKISHEESDEYFQSRDYTSRLGAWASKQSNPLSSRFSLLRDVTRIMVQYPKNVPLPPFWGGFRVEPILFEFWQGRKSRLHDRFQYKKENDIWKVQRLYP